ncbi:uncharacterized protein JCM6883_004207 [Sporobolomyces salmoneus]|uniref:uncharacterized protein n=1 Tax=Sporobolomyces salmoneus TaxID=183962 RepID=UPI003181D7DD
MISFLPYDALECIFEHVEDEQDLARSCLTSRLFLSIAQPRLYNTVRIRIVCWINRNENGQLETYGLSTQTRLLLSKLRQNPHLCSLVRTVNLEGFSVVLEDVDALGPPKPPLEATDLFDKLLRLLPSVQRVWLTRIPHALLVPMDSVVECFQGSQKDKRIPSFGLRPRHPLDSANVAARGAYEGFEQPYPTGSFKSALSLASILRRSHQSLRYLSVHLTPDLDLTILVHLERLALKLPYEPSTVDTVVARVLSPISSLRFLLIIESVGRHTSVDEILTKTLANALPSGLSCLSIEYNHKISPNSFDPFLQALSATSSLKTINFHHMSQSPYEPLSGPEASWRDQLLDSDKTGRETRLIKEMRSRGIRLSFDERWSIW